MGRRLSTSTVVPRRAGHDSAAVVTHRPLVAVLRAPAYTAGAEGLAGAPRARHRRHRGQRLYSRSAWRRRRVVKIKTICLARLVIVGWRPAGAAPGPVGRWLPASKDGRLAYAECGHGLTDRTLAISSASSSLRRDSSPARGAGAPRARLSRARLVAAWSCAGGLGNQRLTVQVPSDDNDPQDAREGGKPHSLGRWEPAKSYLERCDQLRRQHSVKLYSVSRADRALSPDRRRHPVARAPERVGGDGEDVPTSRSSRL